MNNCANKGTKSIEPRKPRRRKPLRKIMDEGTEKTSPIRTHRPSKFPRDEPRYPRGIEDDAETPSEEDDDSSDDPIFARSVSSDASSERSNYPDARAVRRTSESPSFRLETAGKFAESCEKQRVPRRRKTDSSRDERSRDSPSRSRGSRSKGHFYSKCIMCLVAAFTLCACLLVARISRVDSSLESSEPNRLESFKEDIRRMKKKFPRQNHRSWLDIQAGVIDVMNSSLKPWTFVLFSNESETITCLAELLGTASSRALRSEDSLVLRPEDMGREYGDTIDRLRPLILQKKAVVVHDLLEIDPGAIQAFHAMCDRENPLVGEAVYILTIIAPGYTASQRPEAFVENLLTDKFINRVHEDKLQPLITRLTDGPIIPVLPANNPSGCFA